MLRIEGEGPYVLGYLFAEAIAQMQGDSGVAAAFDARSTTSEQILMPEKFMATERALPVDPPDVDGEILWEDSLGMIGLHIELAERLGDATAWEAAAGWGGDRYVAYLDDGGRVCVALRVLGDSPADQAEIGDALSAWAQAMPDARSAADGEVIACDAGAATPVPSGTTFDSLVAAASLRYDLVFAQGVDPTEADRRVGEYLANV